MAGTAVPEIATRAASLRAELKEWERAFAAVNGGKKAGRNDIKNAPEIAAKYKEYSRLKAQESSSNKNKKSHPKSIEPDERSKKRKQLSPNGPDYSQTTFTPQKSTKGIFQTPSKTRTATTHPSDVDPYDSPSVLRRLFSPSTHMQSPPLKTAIGPTPQRDGKALGLFDLLSESGGSTATPSATRIASVKGLAAQTPSKKRKTMGTIVEEEEEEEETMRAERTPVSSGKKYMLSALFATPTTLRYSAMVEDELSSGLLGTSQEPQPTTNEDNASLETPAFLRRSTSGLYVSSNLGAGNGGLSPIAVRKPPKFVGKGLSQLVQGLRDMEEERLDDDLDVLREIEAEEAGLNVEVPDSQMSTEPIGRTFKKKGQKRTTRLVRMKPVISSKLNHKPQPQSQSQSATDKNNESSEGGESDNELASIIETQTDAHGKGNDANGFEDDGWDSLDTISEAANESDSDPDFDADSKPLTRTKSFSEKIKEAIGVVKAQPKDDLEKAKQSRAQEKKEKEKENKKPVARKVNPQAHANYRSLKIRSRGSKWRGGRFRRR